MAPIEIWLAPFMFVALGALFIWLALVLLAEYRKAFMADPGAVMSLEVLIVILRCGPPGYVAVIALFGGALLGGSGLLLFIYLLVFEGPRLLRHLGQALELTFGI
jgi:hypothetical protein